MEVNANKPWVSNYPALRDWLDKIGARCAEQVAVGGSRNPTAYLERWIAPTGRVFLVEVRAYQRGWNIFTDTASTTIAETLANAEARLGLTPAGGLAP